MADSWFVAPVDFAFPSDDEIIHSVEDTVDKIFNEQGLDGLRQLFEGYPTCPTEPGLYALMAPDGVMVGVVTEKTIKGKLERIVRMDAISRLLRSHFEDGMRAGQTWDQISNGSLDKFTALKKQYRLERLGDPSTVIPNESPEKLR
jgi:hypothetical protein